MIGQIMMVALTDIFRFLKGAHTDKHSKPEDCGEQKERPDGAGNKRSARARYALMPDANVVGICVADHTQRTSVSRGTLLGRVPRAIFRIIAVQNREVA